MCVSGEPVYEACLTKVEKVLYRKVMKASEAADVEFYAFSYYYDRAVDVGVIGNTINQSVNQSMFDSSYLNSLTGTIDTHEEE
ncbi:hypothetical protein F2P81_026374 [Scophthalmus maximus]|uniref:Uncharacterized protein n=1 Tax=Scophthalmus maximus TaxID=52904 RepID=A0A6A4RHP5_SCOMX|nr:hypothetical protein F2P81_026374 [Scophthalmus maximus]